MFVALMMIAVALVLLIFALFSLVATLIGAPFVPSSNNRIAQMMHFANIKPTELAVDLGSGDGRIMRAAAARGARVIGVEINPVLALAARFNLWIHGVSPRSRVIIGDFRAFHLAGADTIFCYHLPGKMAALERKIVREAHPGAKVVLNAFPFPHLKPRRHGNHVYLYVMGKS